MRKLVLLIFFWSNSLCFGSPAVTFFQEQGTTQQTGSTPAATGTPGAVAVPMSLLGVPQQSRTPGQTAPANTQVPPEKTPTQESTKAVQAQSKTGSSGAGTVSVKQTSSGIKLNFSDAPIDRVVRSIMQELGYSYVIDPQVQGTVNIFTVREIPKERLFEVLEQLLKMNGQAIVKQEVPEIKNTVAFIGGSTWRATGSNSGQIRIALKPLKERKRSSEQIASVLRRKLSAIPGLTIRTRVGQGLRILRMGTAGDDRVQLEVRGHDLEVSDALAKRVQAVVDAVDGITDSRVSRETGTPEKLVIVDRQKAADMKLTVSKIARMLQTVLSGKTAGYYREAGNEYRILVKLEAAEKKKLQDILYIPITNADGKPVILRNVVEVRPRRGPVVIERKDQQRVTYVTANISDRDMGSILTDVREGLRSVPPVRDFNILFGGDFEEQQEAFRELLMSFVLALVLVYMVMASLYESFRYPFVVMFSVPLAAIGVILMLFFTNTTFNVQSYIGCIMLGGIVVNNAILLVDHINLLRRRDQMLLREAIEEAGRRRLRPILMTAMTTTLAMTPLAIGLGEGGEAQAPMARAIIGGLLSSNLITLVVVPTVYALFERRKLIEETAQSADKTAFRGPKDRLGEEPV